MIIRQFVVSVLLVIASAWQCSAQGSEEPDDTAAGATEIIFGAEPTGKRISTTDQVDYYKFRTRQGTILRIDWAWAFDRSNYTLSFEFISAPNCPKSESSGFRVREWAFGFDWLVVPRHSVLDLPCDAVHYLRVAHGLNQGRFPNKTDNIPTIDHSHFKGDDGNPVYVGALDAPSHRIDPITGNAILAIGEDYAGHELNLGAFADSLTAAGQYQISITELAYPPPPNVLVAGTGLNSNVTLSTGPSSSETNPLYSVERAPTSSGPFTEIADSVWFFSTLPGPLSYSLDASALRYVDSTVVNGTAYFYRVKARWPPGFRQSPPSPVVVATPAEKKGRLKIPKLTRYPVLDGQIEDGEWQEALQLNATSARSVNDILPATVFMMHDGEWLYIATDDENATESVGDSNLRLFIDSDHDGSWSAVEGYREGALEFGPTSAFDPEFVVLKGMYPNWEIADTIRVLGGIRSSLLKRQNSHYQRELALRFDSQPLRGISDGVFGLAIIKWASRRHQHNWWTSFRSLEWPVEAFVEWPETFAELELATSPATDLEEDRGRPAKPSLDAVYPNPSFGQVSVAFRLSRSGPAKVLIFDLLGRETAILADGILPAGQHVTKWEATAIPPGVYLLALETDSATYSRPIVIVSR